MEKRVIISEHQQATTTDANNFGQFPRDSFDHIVDDLGPGFKFTGFAATITATTKVVVGPGRLYDLNGHVYMNDDEGGTELDFIGVLPTVGKRYVGVVASGAEILTQTEPRTFVIDATTRATEGRVTPTISERHANIQTVNGVVGPDPQRPLIPSNYLVFAWVLLNTTGVESVTMEDTNRAPSLETLSAGVDALNVWRIQFGQQLDILATLLANLASRIGGLAAMDFVMRLVVDVTRLKEKAGLPDSYTAWASDYFLDEEESDTANAAYLARIEEGLRFSHAAERVAVLALQNPIDSSVLLAGDLLLPAFQEVRRLSNVAAPTYSEVVIPYVYTGSFITYDYYGNAYVAFYNNIYYRTIFQETGPKDVSISQFANQSFSYVMHYPVRWRVRWGVPYYYSSRINYWWDQRHDPIWWTFRRIASDTAFVVLDGPPFYQPVPLPGIFSWRYQWVRSSWWWWDYIVDYPYWDRVETSHSVNGSVMSQTFLNNQDGWLTGVHVFFTKKGAAGDVTVLLCETYETGQPNPNAVLAVSAALPPAQMRLWPQATRVFFPPTLLMQGKRYAYIFVTSGAHFIATTEQNQLTHGTLFYSTDSAWFQGFGDMSRDVAFENIYAQFTATRSEVQLQPAELSGGIAAIDINTNAQVPGGTTLTFEAQIDGIWTPITDPGPDASDAPLLGLPPLLNIRAVFEGTNALQPSIALGNSSQIYTWRGRADFTHFSELRTMPSPVSTVYVTLRLENWLDTPHHVCTTTLQIGKKALTATVVGAGTGGDYNVGDTVTLANGVVLTVATAGATTITTVTLTNPGHLAMGATPPTNPVGQVSSSGTGTGATFNLTWGDDLQTADVTVDTVTPEDDLAIERKMTFSGMPATSSYQVKIVGTTDNVLTPFHVAERVDIAV
jgi:hypothetical protein